MELEDITQSSCVDILHALGSEFDPFNASTPPTFRTAK